MRSFLTSVLIFSSSEKRISVFCFCIDCSVLVLTPGVVLEEGLDSVFVVVVVDEPEFEVVEGPEFEVVSVEPESEEPLEPEFPEPDEPLPEEPELSDLESSESELPDPLEGPSSPPFASIMPCMSDFERSVVVWILAEAKMLIMARVRVMPARGRR